MRSKSIDVFLSVVCVLVLTLFGRGEANSFAADEWLVQHLDSHNSDWLPIHMRDFVPTNHLRTVSRLLANTNNPAVEIGGVTLAGHGSNTIIYATTGKVRHPNLRGFRLQDGGLYWEAACCTNAQDPGPDSFVLSMPPALDGAGHLYVSDSHYVYCYPTEPTLNAQGKQKWLWRRLMPNLREYDPTQKQWFRTQTPGTNQVFASPFLSFQFTPELNQTSYLAGITVDGEVYVFQPTNGDLVAETYLETNVLTEVLTNAPCDPDQFAAEDDPMDWLGDGKIMMGIWTTGLNTDDPDLDYFMNPCQLDAIIKAGTFGKSTMIANNLCVAHDPIRPNVARIFICGSASERLKKRHPRYDDGYIYRIDFDPTQVYSNRLVVLNYVWTNTLDGTLSPQFTGRMPDGQGSASSPDLSLNERWLFCADNTTNFYCFDTENGHVVWQHGIGAALGSPTTFQNGGSTGAFIEVSFGDYDPWFMLVDKQTGTIQTNSATGELCMRKVCFSSIITNLYWRQDDPGYDATYTNVQGEAFTRIAIGASVIVGSSNKVIMVYTVGWHNPIDPNGYLFTIPTHSVILVVDLEDIWSAANIVDLLDSAYIDTNDTCEVGLIPAPDGYNRGLIIYGAQSSSMAQFMAVNGTMPKGMQSLYIRPHGGFRILELPFLNPADIQRPEIIDFQLTNGSCRIDWSAVPGIHYAVEYENGSLSETNWSCVFQHKAYGTVQHAVDKMPSSGKPNFYRIRVEP